ncbi:MAG: aminoacyl-tRNA hydrolase [Candidatus Kerfeldbacteria bacterium]
MKTALLFVGLGNPGEQYERTRHNIGYRVVDSYVAKSDSPLKSKRGSLFTELTRGKGRIYVLKPNAFMNASGDAVSSFMRYYNIPPERLWVIHDDVDLPFGSLRASFDRGDAGHQGVASIIERLGSKAFNRLRIGIGSNKPLGILSEEYVLQQFTEKEEMELSKKVLPAALEKLATIETELLKSE